MTLEENYKVEERSNDAIKKHGTIDKAIAYLQAELNSFEDMWSEYSCDCLGMGITCNQLIINNLKHKQQ
jgi:tRNA(Phe) wybutosine-synthesizing methylase Tyw3